MVELENIKLLSNLFKEELDKKIVHSNGIYKKV